MTSAELDRIKSDILAMPALFADKQATYHYTGSGDSPTFSIDKSVFGTKISQVVGEYVFTFSTSGGSSSWALNSSSVVLSQYGIEVQGSPNNGDTIVVDYGINLSTIPKSSSDNSVSFDMGYTSSYDNAGQNPKPIERTKMNWLFRLLSQGSFFGQTGIRYTFNSAVSTEIGGYPLGAVLALDDGTSIRNVVSLVDNNTYDFVTNGVDNQHWKYLDDASNSGIYPDYGSSEYLISAQIPANTQTITQVCDWVSMPRDGWLYPQFVTLNGLTTYLVLGPADGSTPSVVFTEDEYKDMIPDDDNTKSYTSILLGNNTYSNKNLIPVKAGTKMAVFGKNTASVGSGAAGVYIRLYRNYL